METTSLDFLRDVRQWNEEIPRRILHSTSRPNTFKVRKAWFTGVVGALENAITDGEITDPAVIQVIAGFMEHYTSEEFLYQPRTRRADITRANEIIDIALGDLPPSSRPQGRQKR